MSESSIPSSLWPFKEAQKLLKRVGNKSSESPVLFETGYGPSGLPHIGTFGEVARTTWVKQAFEQISGRKTRLLTFSDDMDALRKVPDNVPNKEMLAKYIGIPLSRIPDPFGEYESFSAHNNARLRQFLDSFGFDYEFASAADYYSQGRFDKALKKVLEKYDRIIKVILPTLGKERRATYSPVLPIHPETGHVMQVPIIDIDPDKGLVLWKDDHGTEFETSVYGGHAKMQWKADWAMRWYALGVDYEMSGKDLIDSVRLSSKICRILGGTPPETLTYELFLDSEGQKISKSKGNGLSVEEWLRYGPSESLAQYMFQQPGRAKRLYFDMIPRATDDYLSQVKKASEQTEQDFMGNPVWFIHNGQLRKQDTSPVSFTALLNLASVASAQEPETLWKFLHRYDHSLTPDKEPYLAQMVQHAIAYFNDRVKPTKVYRAPTEQERKALEDLLETLKKAPQDMSPDDVQTLVFTVGKRYFDKADLRLWFGCLYEVLLGQSQGPRFGVFAALYGLPETIKLLDHSLNRDTEIAVQKG